MVAFEEAISDELLFNITKHLNLDYRLQFKLVSNRWRRVVNCNLKLILAVSGQHKLIEPADEQYVTSIAASENSKVSQESTLFSIKHSIAEVLGCKQLAVLHLGAGISGLARSTLMNILWGCAETIEELSWVVQVSKSTQTQPENLTFSRWRFPKLKNLSVQISHGISHFEELSAFVHFVQGKFPLLSNIAVHAYTDPVDQRCCAWKLYMEIFSFIARNRKNLRHVALDYFHLDLRTSIASDSWLVVSEFVKIRAMTSMFRRLELEGLQLSVPEKEGNVPWKLAAELLASQENLSDLDLKHGNGLHLPLSKVIRLNAKSLKNLRVAACNYSQVFNAKLLGECENLRCLDLSYFDRLTNCSYFPSSLRKVKIFGNYLTKNLVDVLRKCTELRQLTLGNDGAPWIPVSAETVRRCFDESCSLRKLQLHYFEEEDISNVCTENGWMFSVSRRCVRHAVIKKRSS